MGLNQQSKELSSRKSRVLRAAILVCFLIGGTLVIWFGLGFVLGTQTPFLVVSSPSMVPALNVGDEIVVKADPFNQLNVGDIIVFQQRGVVYVHRVHNITDSVEGRIIVTKGDANSYLIPGIDYPIREDNYVGRVVLTIPYIGLLAKYLAPPYNYMLIALLLVIFFISEILPDRKKIDKDQTPS